MGLGDGSGILHQAVAGAPPVTRDGGAFGYVAAEDPLILFVGGLPVTAGHGAGVLKTPMPTAYAVQGTLNLMSPMSDTRPGSPRLVCSKAVPASEPCLRPHPRHSHPRASFGARPSRFARADPHDGQRGWDLNSAAASAKVPKPVCLRQRRSAQPPRSLAGGCSSAFAQLGHFP